MTAGALGSIVFEVSDETVLTLSSFSWEGSARLGTHQRHLTDSLTEFLGRGPDSITFDMILSAYLGGDVQKTLRTLWDYERNGTAVSFVLGNKAYGKYRWLVSRHTAKAQFFGPDGSMTQCRVSVTLQEYTLR